MKKTSTKESGFTIIEVVLVLAIAGLIFLVVFLALPALQRSQRDSQRRSDLGRMLAQLETYASNNNGAYPANQANTDTFELNYLRNDGAVWSDPQNEDATVNGYDIVWANGAAAPTIDDNNDNVYYRTNAQCGTAEGTFATGSGSRSIAAIVGLENGIAYCQDNR